MTPLTPRQRDIFNWIAQFIVDHEYPPTVREIGHAFENTPTVVWHLKMMRHKGWIEYADLGERTITVSWRAKAEIGMAGPHFISTTAVAQDQQ